MKLNLSAMTVYLIEAAYLAALCGFVAWIVSSTGA